MSRRTPLWGALLAAVIGALPLGAAAEQSAALELVLERSHRQLRLLRDGTAWKHYPVAIGRPGWETPLGRFAVLELVREPIWVHPATGQAVAPGPANPLGSRWIGFAHDCSQRRGFNGRPELIVRDCATTGFHGTPLRSSIGQAVSHGCVRLREEDIRELFELVELGTPVTVLP